MRRRGGRARWLPRTRRGWVLAVAAVAYVSAALWGSSTGGQGASRQSGIWELIVLLGAHLLILLTDGERYLTLNRRVDWRRLGAARRVLLVVAYAVGFVMPPIYLAIAAYDGWEAGRRAGRHVRMRRG